MDFLHTKLSCLLLAPSHVQTKIKEYLTENKLLKPMRMISKEEFLSAHFFIFDENAILYIMKSYDVKKDIAEKYLNSLFYIDDSNSENMLFLKKLKKELEEHNLLMKNQVDMTYDEYYILGYDGFTKLERSILEKYPFVEIKKEYEDKNIGYLFSDKEEEVAFVFEDIMKKLESGIPLSHIILTNIDESYYLSLLRIGRMYGFTISLSSPSYYVTEEYKKVKEKILNKEEVEEKYGRKLVNKLNQIKEVDEDIIDLYAKEIKIESKSDIKIEPLLHNFFKEEDYVYILNANDTFLPKTYKDEDYLYDSITPSIKETTIEKNNLEEEMTKKALKKIKNKIITLRKKDDNILYPSLLLSEVKECEFTYSNYSNLYNKNRTIYLSDLKRKYKIETKDYHLLKNTYPILYFTYDYQTTKLKKEIVEELLKENVYLSYSSLSTFFECEYKYYLTYLLKLLEKEQTFSAYLGSFSHFILEQDTYKESDIDTYLKENKKDLSFMEQYFLEKEKKELPFIFDFYKDFKKHSKYQNYKNESTVFVPIDDTFTLMGKIDKIMKYEDNIILIDYKTGEGEIDFDKVKYGLAMQLAIYAYLVKKKYPYQLEGLYIQHILKEKGDYKKGKTKEDIKRENLKFQGYTYFNLEKLEELDSTYKDSRFIGSIKITNDGRLSSFAKTFTDETLEEVLKITDEKIKEAIKKIKEGHFHINPKTYNDKDVSCKYCKYKDICYFKGEKEELEGE